MFFQMDPGQRKKLDCSGGAHSTETLHTEPTLFCLPLRLVLMRAREEYESQGVKAYAYFDGITIGASEITLGTAGVAPFLERELTARGTNLNLGKTAALAPKGHVPTPEDLPVLAGVGAHIADEGGVKVLR